MESPFLQSPRTQNSTSVNFGYWDRILLRFFTLLVPQIIWFLALSLGKPSVSSCRWRQGTLKLPAKCRTSRWSTSFIIEVGRKRKLKYPQAQFVGKSFGRSWVGNAVHMFRKVVYFMLCHAVGIILWNVCMWYLVQVRVASTRGKVLIATPFEKF